MNFVEEIQGFNSKSVLTCLDLILITLYKVLYLREFVACWLYLNNEENRHKLDQIWKYEKRTLLERSCATQDLRMKNVEWVKESRYRRTNIWMSSRWRSLLRCGANRFCDGHRRFIGERVFSEDGAFHHVLRYFYLTKPLPETNGKREKKIFYPLLTGWI